MRPVAGLDDDPGAQPQRTMLAWNRTVQAAVLGALVAALTAERQRLPVVAGIAGLTALSLLVVALRDLRSWEPTASPWPAVLHAGVAVLVLAAIGLVIAMNGVLS